MNPLLDFMQGASNAAASTVSAPVDGIAWLLKKAGVPVGVPVGGSDWMAQKGLTAPTQSDAGMMAMGMFPAANVGRVGAVANALQVPKRAAYEAALAEKLARDQTALAFRSTKRKKFTPDEVRQLRELGYDI